MEISSCETFDLTGCCGSGSLARLEVHSLERSERINGCGFAAAESVSAFMGPPHKIISIVIPLVLAPHASGPSILLNAQNGETYL